MRQLTGLDVQFLAMESGRQCGHVSMLLELDPRTRPGGRLELTDVQDLIAERLPLLPPFRWRLRTVPFGLDYPYWLDDPDFDLEYHVRELALPAPATPQRLGEQIARIVARPLDRARPLWEVYLIHGLPDGHVGVLTKVHHAAVDGVSGAEILGILLDPTPEGREAPAPLGGGEREPSELEMLARGLIAAPRYVGRVLRAAPTLLPNLEDSPLLAELPGAKRLGRASASVARTLRRGGRESRVLERTTLKAPRTSFNGRVSPHRRFAYAQLPLADAKAVKDANGCTLNDVVISVVAGAVRRWLIDHAELPDAPLVAQIPISVRTEEQRGTYGNRIGTMSAPVHTEEPDPITRLRLTNAAMSAIKERYKAIPATLLQNSNEFIPPAVFARATRVTLSLAASRKPIWNLIISNVPGPQIPLYLAGSEMKAIYPVSAIVDGAGLNVTVFSYCGHLDFGVIADREQVPDVWKIIDYLAESLQEHKAASIPTEVD
jgi:diacylglycerol O-acyltransferase